jgi:hypothetical protein
VITKISDPLDEGVSFGYEVASILILIVGLAFLGATHFNERFPLDEVQATTKELVE